MRTFILLFAASASLAIQAVQGHQYRLPFPVGDTARLIQGPNGPWGHSGHSAWSWDFVMPVGSPVVAAREGTVVAVVERFADFTRKPGEENYVVIAHGDSTFSRYYHLTQDGALVDSGRRVAAGDTIGRSGSSGASAGPHLHFDVTTGCAEWGCQTVSIRFLNVEGDSLAPGRTYRAAPVTPPQR